MIVDTEETVGTVTIRHATPALVLRGIAAALVAIGAPAVAERWVPWLLAPALLLTAAAAAWVVTAMGRAVVLDERGVTLAPARRRVRRVDWSQVGDLTTDGERLVVRTVAGHALRGPRCPSHLLDEALREARRLGLISGDPW